MTTSENIKGCAPDQENAALNNQLPENHTSSAGAEAIASRSTATEIQLKKVMALLRQGPKTTVDLRDHGIMMPAPRIHHLRHVDGHTISSESVTLYDANGFRHSKCARYHLLAEVTVEDSAK